MTRLTLNYVRGTSCIRDSTDGCPKKNLVTVGSYIFFLISVCVCEWSIPLFLLRLSNLFHDGAFLLGNYLQPNHIHHPLAWVYWHHTTIQHQCQLLYFVPISKWWQHISFASIQNWTFTTIVCKTKISCFSFVVH